MGILWIAAIAVFALLEAATAQFICIWFAGGAVCALIAELLGAGGGVQSIIFVIASAILLMCSRPFVKRMMRNGTERTNADSLIGKRAVMTKSVSGTGENGEAKIDGKYWTVRSSDGEPIAEGSVVTVEKIEGVKLIVKED